MSLSAEERKAIIEYRMERALSTFDEAQKILGLNLYNLTANRLYYTVYYAATSLLLHKGLSSHTHRGAMTLFHMNIVKTGIMSTDDGALFRQLFGMRHEGDYEDFVDYTKDDIEPFFPLVEIFINKVKDLIKDNDAQCL